MTTPRKVTELNRLNKIFGILNNLHDGLLMIVFVAAILISGYGIYDVWYVYCHADDSRLTEFTADSPASQLERLHISEGLVGWISFKDTGINFPVMQGNSNLTFLNRDPYGNFSLSGSIFLDSRNSPEFTDGYSLIYGHHMEYGKMFGALDAFLDSSYASSHRNGTLLIGRDGHRKSRLTVFAVMRSDAKELAAFDVENPGNARDYILSHAQIKLGEPSGNFLALSTCDGEDDSMRIITAGSLD